MSSISKQDMADLLRTYGLDISSIVDNEDSLKALYEAYVSYSDPSEKATEDEIRTSMIASIEEEIERLALIRGNSNGGMDGYRSAVELGASDSPLEWRSHVQYPMRSSDCCRAGVIVRYDLYEGVSHYIRQCKRSVPSASESKLCSQHELCAPPIVRYALNGVSGSFLTGGSNIARTAVDLIPDEATMGTIEEIFQNAHDAAKNAENRMKKADYTEFLSKLKKDKKRFEKRMRDMAFVAVSELTHKLDTLRCDPPPMDDVAAIFSEGKTDLCDDDDDDAGDSN